MIGAIHQRATPLTTCGVCASSTVTIVQMELGLQQVLRVVFVVPVTKQVFVPEIRATTATVNILSVLQHQSKPVQSRTICWLTITTQLSQVLLILAAVAAVPLRMGCQRARLLLACIVILVSNDRVFAVKDLW